MNRKRRRVKPVDEALDYLEMDKPSLECRFINDYLYDFSAMSLANHEKTEVSHIFTSIVSM